MLLIIGIVLGGLAGAVFGFGVAGALLGALVGGVLGALLQYAGRKPQPPADMTSRVALLEARVAGLEKALHRLVDEAARGVAAAPAPGVAPLPGAPAASVPAAVVEAPVHPAIGAGAAAAPLAPAVTVAEPASPIAAPARSASLPPIEPPPVHPLWRWITGGNVLARVGAVVLFIGVAFLARYAVEHVTVPVELRLAGIAALGLALLGFGWRLRHARRGYALTLQGAGVGVLYLTVFASFSLYHLLPPALALFLLVAFVAEAGVLAVRQDALALAVLGTLGGFAAPVLVSSGSGNHVALFTFYAVLDAGIFVIAWLRPWRALNLLGFACTFIIATAWGVLRYRPEDFATTEPFLVLFFLFYVGIAVAYATRRSLEVRAPIDGTLVFGTPLVAAGLQAGLVREYEFGMAISAVAMAVVYIALAYALAARRRDGLRLLVDAFAALGLVFATLAIPLALDARWTSATWALEGAALAWVGLRQRRFALRTFGVLLQFAAALAYLRGVEVNALARMTDDSMILNSRFIGTLLIAIAGVFTSWRYESEALARRPGEQPVAAILLGWGVAWWLAGGATEIARFARGPHAVAWFVAWLGATTLALLGVARLLRFALARYPTLGLAPALLVLALGGAAVMAGSDRHLFEGLHGLAWIGAMGAAVLALHRLEHMGRVSRALLAGVHVALLWLCFVVLAEECAWLVRAASPREAWRLASWLLVCALGAIALCAWHAPRTWPFDRWRDAHVRVGVGVVVLVLVAVALVVNFASDGDSSPLPYVPLLNPLDVTFATIALAAILWWREAGAIAGTPALQGLTAAVGSIALLLWISGSTVRVAHHFADVPFRFDAAWHSSLVQAALALVWTTMALATMVLGNRRGSRSAWIGGAALLGVVVVKLLLVDLASTGTVAQIVSFIGVGLLLLLVGYLAPLPARRSEAVA